MKTAACSLGDGGEKHKSKSKLFYTENRYLEHLPKCLDWKEVSEEEEENKTHKDVEDKVDQLGAWGEGGQVVVKLEDDWDQTDQQVHRDKIVQDGAEHKKVDYAAIDQSVYGDVCEQRNAEVLVEAMPSVAQFRSTSELHITIQNGSPIKLARCFTCCEKFHCPFCKPEVYKPTVKSKLKNHIAAHNKRAVHFKGYIIFKCNLFCSPHAHFHCPNCPMLIHKKNRYLDHLPKCLVGKEVRHSATEEEEEGKMHTEVGEMIGLSGSRDEQGLIIVKLEDNQMDQQLYREQMSQDEAEDQKMNYTVVEHRVHGDAGEGNAQVLVETMTSVAQIRSISKLCTIIQSGSPIKLARCFTCCKKFHCPFCKPEVFKPTVESKLKNHIAAHKKRAVHFKGYTIFKCNHLCSPYAHFHCPECPMIFHKKNRYLEHLPKCLTGKIVSLSAPKEEEESKIQTVVEQIVGQSGPTGKGGQIKVKLEDDQLHKEEMSKYCT